MATAVDSLAALVGAALLLITRRLKPERVFHEVDWSLLVFFAALFVVTGAIGHTGLMPVLEGAAGPVLAHGTAALTIAGAVLSNLISNVPAVLLFRPLMAHAPDPQLAWLTLAMATTFAGNLTLLGSVANLIVAETAKRHDVHLGFMEYLRAGLPITLATLALGAAWLAWVGGTAL
jgi:Na+/H+ antiporter NhaD/arsenite permease-like protein